MQQHLQLNSDTFQQEDINKLIETIKIKQISCGYYHIMLLDQNNNIYTCGRNSDGQLGLGHNNYKSSFEKVNLFNNSVKLIATGGYSSMVVTLDNKIYGTGSILYSSLKNTDLRSTFREIKLQKEEENNKEFKNLKCGGEFAILMNNKSELFGCGHYSSFQLGEQVKEMEFGFVKLNLNLNVKNFFCGYLFSLILTKEGDVYCSGASNYSSNTFKNYTKLDLTFKCKEIGAIYNDFYLLSQNNELYFRKKKLNFTKPIKKLTLGLSSALYLLTEENEIYKVRGENISKFDEFTFNLKHLYIYPAYEVVAFLNSDFNIDEEEESKEVVRMKRLLFNNVLLGDLELKIYI